MFTALRPPSIRLAARSLRLRVMSSGSEIQALPIYTSMQKKLTENLKPEKLKIDNESYKHAGHSGNPTGAADAETHFRVEVVSTIFEGVPLVKRHRMIYTIVDEEIRKGVHALSLITKTPKEAGPL